MASREDYPTGFSDSTTALCGIPHPEYILTDLSACCDGPVEISNGCFQYCETSLDVITFAQCASVTVDLDPHFITTCNKAASRKPVEHVMDTDLLEDLVESDGWLSYLWKRIQRLLSSAYEDL